MVSTNAVSISKNYGWLSLFLGTIVTLFVSLYISSADDSNTIPVNASVLSMRYSVLTVACVGILAGAISFNNDLTQKGSSVIFAVVVWIALCVVERNMSPFNAHVLHAVYISILGGFFIRKDKNMFASSMHLSVKVTVLFATLVAFRHAFRSGRELQREKLRIVDSNVTTNVSTCGDESKDNVKQAEWKITSLLVSLYMIHIVTVCSTTLFLSDKASTSMDWIVFVDTTIVLALVTHVLPDAMRLVTANNKYVSLYAKENRKLLPVATVVLVLSFMMAQNVRLKSKV